MVAEVPNESDFRVSRKKTNQNQMRKSLRNLKQMRKSLRNFKLDSSPNSSSSSDISEQETKRTKKFILKNEKKVGYLLMMFIYLKEIIFGVKICL